MASRLRMQRLDPAAILPARAHPDDAGLDLRALDAVEIAPGRGVKIRTGIAMEIPQGFVGMIADRSSLAARGLKTAGGIIDSGYRGEVQIVMRNLTHEGQRLEAGERMAQLLIIPVALPEVEEVSGLSESARAQGGFGSTGRN